MVGCNHRIKREKMNETVDQKNADKPVISPLANEKTYGERVYSRIFNWGFNYWTNLFVSAGFSHWAENGTKPFRIPFLMKEALSPQEMQQRFAKTVREYDPFFKRFEKNTLRDMAGEAAAVVEKTIFDRSMARARSLTLLIPGFFVVIPSVWIGAKVKPAIVGWLNRHHYGEEAMNDPSLKARQQAIENEAQPTFFGTVFARMGTMFAAQATAQLIGSNHNLLQRMGAKNFTGIDEVTEKLGASLGGAAPEALQTRFSSFARKLGFDWSQAQKKAGIAEGLYSKAMPDFSRFVVMDTIYTFVTAITIAPMVKLLPKVPFIGHLMTHKPKHAANSPTLDGDVVKVPPNSYTDRTNDTPMPPAANDPAALDVARETEAVNDHAYNTGDQHKPHTKISHAHAHETLAATPHLKHAGAGA